MKIAAKQIIGLKVETKSGQHLGRVRDFDLDADTLEVKTVYARPKSIAKELVSGDLIINRNLIIFVDDKKIIVDDLLARELARSGGADKKIAAEGAPLVAANME